MSPGAAPLPIRSPLNSIGASCFSPSPITTMPSIATESMRSRMASTAAGQPRSCRLAHPARQCQGGGLGDADEFRGQVPVGRLFSSQDLQDVARVGCGQHPVDGRMVRQVEVVLHRKRATSRVESTPSTVRPRASRSRRVSAGGSPAPTSRRRAVAFAERGHQLVADARQPERGLGATTTGGDEIDDLVSRLREQRGLRVLEVLSGGLPMPSSAEPDGGHFFIAQSSTPITSSVYVS